MGTWRGWLLLSTAALLAALMAWGQPRGEKAVFLLLGPPGSGKTTQARNLSRQYGVPSISMSDILKKEAGWVKTPLKKGMKAHLESGDFVSDELANTLIEKHIAQKRAERGFILDGYPATVKQAEYLENTLKERGLPAPVVIHLEAPDKVVIDRMNNRGRADDNPATIERRIADYHREAEIILARYGSRTRSVDATQSPDAVWRDIRQALAR
ncbi:MAG: nucleoside monophosphate kinase [Bryobacteraceae bacterium]|nr:nucleoside monophosphate kinase [Bryobacteraceae bacterium]